VAEETVNGILTNTELIMLPWYAKYMLILKAVVPWSAYLKFSEAFGTNRGMDDFTGRRKED